MTPAYLTIYETLINEFEFSGSWAVLEKFSCNRKNVQGKFNLAKTQECSISISFYILNIQFEITLDENIIIRKSMSNTYIELHFHNKSHIINNCLQIWIAKKCWNAMNAFIFLLWQEMCVCVFIPQRWMYSIINYFIISLLTTGEIIDLRFLSVVVICFAGGYNFARCH